MELTHFISQVRLVTDSGGHTAQQRRYLRTGLGETENVVDEQQHVLMLDITEVLSHGQTGQCDTQTRARGLIHLSEDQCSLIEDSRLFHLVNEVISFTRTFANARED